MLVYTIVFSLDVKNESSISIETTLLLLLFSRLHLISISNHLYIWLSADLFHSGAVPSGEYAGVGQRPIGNPDPIQSNQSRSGPNQARPAPWGEATIAPPIQLDWGGYGSFPILPLLPAI